MTAADRRRLQVMLGLSLGVHAVLFAGLTLQRKPLPALLPTLQVALRSAVPATAAAAVVPLVEPLARRALPQPAAVPPQVRPLLQNAPLGLTGRHDEAAGPTTPSPANSVASLPASAPAAAREDAPARAEPAAPPPANPNAAAEALANYRQRLGELFAARQDYPRLAAMRGWEGEVRLRLRVARQGQLINVALDHSSGFDVLDRHALALVEAMASLPPLPAALDLAEIQVIVPINYKLRKTT